LSWSSSKKSKDDLLVVRVRDSVIALGASLGRPPGIEQRLALVCFGSLIEKKKTDPSESEISHLMMQLLIKHRNIVLTTPIAAECGIIYACYCEYEWEVT
jgi:hypothetical protein